MVKLDKRILYADILRIMATLAVITLHVSGSRWYITPVTTLEWKVFTAYNSLVRAAVPVFVMISGMFMLDPNKKLTIARLFKKYVLRIVIALAFWGVFYGAASLAKGIAKGNDSLTLRSILAIPAKILFGPPWYHLWFLYTIIALYLLTPILRVFIAFCSKRELEYAILVLIIFGRIIPPINKALSLLHNPMAINLTIVEATGYISYYLAGYYFSRYELRRGLRISAYLLGIISVLITFGATCSASARTEVPTEYFFGNGMPTTMATAFAIFIYVRQKYFETTLSYRTRNFIAALSDCTFGTYLIHDFINQVFIVAGFNTVSINPLVAIPLLSICNFCISIVIVASIRKVPWIGTRIT